MDTNEVVDVPSKEFLYLGSRVHVYGVTPGIAVHGVIVSPLIPIYLGESNAMGYLVRLDAPLPLIIDEGQLQVIFVHHTAVSEIGGEEEVSNVE